MSRSTKRTPGGMRRARFVVPLVIMGAMFVVSGVPEGLPPLPRGSDKLLHAAAYGALGLAWCWALGAPTRAPWRTALLAFAASLAWGLSDEYHQAHVPGRMASWGDLAADALGAGLACAGWALLVARARRGALGTEGPGEA